MLELKDTLYFHIIGITAKSTQYMRLAPAQENHTELAAQLIIIDKVDIIILLSPFSWTQKITFLPCPFVVVF